MSIKAALILKAKKPTWTHPVLIVLGRGKPEESVLLGCKLKDGAGPKGMGCTKNGENGTCHGKTFS